jgi:hypothetical protein
VGLALSEHDEEITAEVLALWQNANAWPFRGATPAVKEIELCGRTYRSHGFIEQLGLHVVLGFDRSEDRNLRRAGGIELFKEVEIKKTLLRTFTNLPILHLESYEQARDVERGLADLGHRMPTFSVRTHAFPEPRPFSMVVWEIVSFIEQLGLDVRNAISRCSLLADDSETTVLHATSLLWSAFERHMIESDGSRMTYGRLLSVFSSGEVGEGANLRYVARPHLARYQHLLIDDAHELSPAASRAVRSIMAEHKRRSVQADRTQNSVSASLMYSGDPLGRVLGNRGASAQALTGFAAYFGAPGVGPIAFTKNFWGAPNLLQLSDEAGAPLNLGAPRQTTSGRADQTAGSFRFETLDTHSLAASIEAGLQAGLSVVVVPDGADSFSRISPVLLPIHQRLNQDQGTSKRLFVRQASKVRDVQADLIVLVGSFEANASATAFRNQVFQFARQGASNETSPYVGALAGDGLASVATCLARAKTSVVWFGAGKRFLNTSWGRRALSS